MVLERIVLPVTPEAARNCASSSLVASMWYPCMLATSKANEGRFQYSGAPFDGMLSADSRIRYDPEGARSTRCSEVPLLGLRRIVR